VKTAVQKVKTAQLYAQSFKNEMEVYSFEELNQEDTVEFAMLKSIFDGYSKNGNTETLDAKYYAEIPLNSGKYFKGLSRKCCHIIINQDSRLHACVLQAIEDLQG
jgi:hypothetical protein